MTAASWADVPAGCICRWNAADGGPWSRVTPNPRCLAEHEED
jgi:hypothetical protein